MTAGLRSAMTGLLDPARHPWLNGRLLWLQIIVRGFWHATGHLGGYYLGHGRPERAVALQAHALAEAIEANPDLRAHASRDPDLAALREV